MLLHGFADGRRASRFGRLLVQGFLAVSLLWASPLSRPAEAPDDFTRWAEEGRRVLQAEKTDLDQRYLQAQQALQRAQAALSRAQQANHPQAITISQQAVQTAEQALENVRFMRQRNLSQIAVFNRTIQWRVVNSPPASGSGSPRGVLTGFTAGEVLVQTAQGAWRPFDGQRPLMEGEVIRTTAQGRAEFRFNDGSLVILDRNTELRLDQRGDCLSLYRLYKGTMHGELGPHIGRSVETRIEGGLPCIYERHYHTPIAVAAVRGTAFDLAYLPDGSSSLAVYEGEVELQGSKSNKKIVVKQGERAVVLADGTVTGPTKGDARPAEKWWEKF